MTEAVLTGAASLGLAPVAVALVRRSYRTDHIPRGFALIFTGFYAGLWSALLLGWSLWAGCAAWPSPGD